MKILYISPLPPDYVGGLSYFVKNIAINLNKKKSVNCDILTIDLLNHNKKIEFLNNSIRIFYKKKIVFIEKNILYPISFLINTLKKKIKEYNIVHVHGYHFFTSLQCAFLRHIIKFKLILHLHGGIQTDYHKGGNFFEKLLLVLKEKFFDKIIGKFIIKSADKIISVSNDDLRILKKKFNIKAKNLIYIPIGVDTEKFKRFQNIERKYITLLATRLTYVKGIDIFLNIADKLYDLNKDIEFLIVGDGPLKKEVCEAQKRLPIKFCTSYEYNKIQEIYNMSKILLITSRTEGIPSVIYESLACETPVISSNVGGIKRIIQNDYNGFLFNIKNPNEAIKLTLDLINDEEKLIKLGKNGRDLIKRLYSWEKITNTIYNVYRELLLE